MRRRRLVLALAALATACGRPAEPLPPPHLVGRATCEGCHAAQAASWSGSDHDRAMEVAGEGTVLGDFAGATFTHFGVTSTFTKEDGKFLVRTDGPDGKLHDYEIAYTFGVDPLQQYLIRFPGGRLQALSVCWDTRPKEAGGQRWFHLYPKERMPHDDVLHWTGIYQNWNFMCAECHSTGVKKGYDAARDAFDTTSAEIDVSCEACHGPGSNHVAWAAQRKPSQGLGLAVRLGEPGRWVMDRTTGIAKRDRPRTSQAELETCGRCHARRGVVSEDYVHGRPLMDTHRVALLDDGLYHADGQILEEDYEYGSFVQSKMHAAGVTCTDCHDPHTLRTASGNAVCAPCHLPERFDTPAHHHHEAGGKASACTACHMPATHYMVVDARHDHGFKVPRPDLTAKTGAPDVCTGCHADKPHAWSVAAHARLFGEAGASHWSETIAAGRADPAAAAPALAALARDAGQPGIVRATAAMLAGGASDRTFEALTAALADPDPLVRDATVRALAAAEPERRARLLAPLTLDPVRTVRIDAGRALAGAPAELLDAKTATEAAAALEEWKASQAMDADRPEARLNLCALHAELGEIDAALEDCRAALRLAPRIPSVYVTLADVYRAAGRETEAEATLRDGLRVDARNGTLWHALGLGLIRQRRAPEALEALREATRLEPANARFTEVYRIAKAELSAGRDPS
jgi:tetratricopeptide (TPR) repeat protein